VGTLAALAAAAALLPGFSPSATGPAGGMVLTGVYPGTQRAGYLYLPPGFGGAARYPVVYLLHGMPGSPSEYLAGTDLAAWADREVAAGSIRPFIAVLPAAGPDRNYNGEWAGPLERALVDRDIPFVDHHLPTIATARGRVIAGLSAGGFGAADIGLRHPRLFGAIEAWSAYFQPLHDGPFKHASRATLAANDPTLLAPSESTLLRGLGTRLFLSSGPAHSHWFKPAETLAFARELRAASLPVSYHLYASLKGEWRSQLDTGLAWALRRPSG
jgi:enterochelin esterase-like enzyme